MSLALHPNLVAYLDRVPGGLEAHPTYCVKGSVIAAMLEDESTEVRRQLLDLPEPLAAHVQAPPVATAWVPEVHMVSLFLAIANLTGPSDEEILAKAKGVNRRLFERPMYRALGMMIRPSRAVGYFSSIFGRFHRGVELSWDRAEDNEMHGRLTFAEYLYPREMVLALSTSFEAASELGASNSTCEVGDVGPEAGHFVLRWT